MLLHVVIFSSTKQIYVLLKYSKCVFAYIYVFIYIDQNCLTFKNLLQLNTKIIDINTNHIISIQYNIHILFKCYNISTIYNKTVLLLVLPKIIFFLYEWAIFVSTTTLSCCFHVQNIFCSCISALIYQTTSILRISVFHQSYNCMINKAPTWTNAYLVQTLKFVKCATDNNMYMSIFLINIRSFLRQILTRPFFLLIFDYLFIKNE